MDCSQFTGRKRDLCEGRGHDGRPDPRPEACEQFRRKYLNAQSQLPAQKSRGFRNANKRVAITPRPAPTYDDASKSTNKARQLTTADIPCLARGLVIRQDTSNLCGSRGKSIDIYRCQKFEECSLGRYCQHQTVRTCAVCTSEGQHVPPDSMLPVIQSETPATIEPTREIPLLPLDVTCHLTYHVWPVRERGTWQHNIDQLLRRIDLFNGRRIMGIATGPGAEPAESVMDYVAGHGFEFVVLPNSRKLREVVTWLPMLELLEPHASGPGNVVFSAHAKGVRHAAAIDDPGTTIHRWATAMYDVLLDSWDDCREKLDTHPFVGLFKRTNAFRTPGNHCWHYSGTFFWWRPDVIFRRNWRRVDRRFYGVESWPGLMATRDEAACLLGNEPGDLYLPQTWERIQKEIDEWNRIHSGTLS